MKIRGDNIIYFFVIFRFIQIDIDDVFVGASGSLFTANDIRALINLQEELRNSIENFTFSLGFSGYFFRHGSDAEIEGNDFLVGIFCGYLNDFFKFL